MFEIHEHVVTVLIRATLKSAYIEKKNIQRFSFIIGGFSLRATLLQVNGKYLVWRLIFH